MIRTLLVLLAALTAATTFFVGAPTAWAADVTLHQRDERRSIRTARHQGECHRPRRRNLYPQIRECHRQRAGRSRAPPCSSTGYTEPSTIGGNVLAVEVCLRVAPRQCHGQRKCADPTVQRDGPNGFQGPDIVINGNFHLRGELLECRPSCLAWLGKVVGNVKIPQNHGQDPLTSAS